MDQYVEIFDDQPDDEDLSFRFSREFLESQGLEKAVEVAVFMDSENRSFSFRFDIPIDTEWVTHSLRDEPDGSKVALRVSYANPIDRLSA